MPVTEIRNVRNMTSESVSIRNLERPDRDLTIRPGESLDLDLGYYVPLGQRRARVRRTPHHGDHIRYSADGNYHGSKNQHGEPAAKVDGCSRVEVISELVIDHTTPNKFHPNLFASRITAAKGADLGGYGVGCALRPNCRGRSARSWNPPATRGSESTPNT